MRKIIIYIIVSLTLISCGDVYKDVTYSGYVYDAETNDPIEGLVVDISANKETRAITNGVGYYYAKMNVDCVYDTAIDAGSFIYESEAFSLDRITCDNQKVKHDFYLNHNKNSELNFYGIVYLENTATPIGDVKIYLSNSEIIQGNENIVYSDNTETDLKGKFTVNDYIDYVTEISLHAEKAGYISTVKQFKNADDWTPNIIIYLEEDPNP